MASAQIISKIEIPLESINYDEKSKRLSLNILDFTFIGHYKKNIKINEILNDIHKALIEARVNIERKDIYLIDQAKLKISETLQLKDLNLRAIKSKMKITSKQIIPPKEREKVSEEELGSGEEADAIILSEESKELMDDKVMHEEAKRKEAADTFQMLSRKKEAKAAIKPAAPPSAGARPSSPAPTFAETRSRAESIEKDEGEAPIAPKKTRYDINMGLQYYSIMMEKQSYLFYVYFSHKELIIEDEEGKVVYKTKITIITTKEESPILDLRVEGEGFEVHPLSGKVEVKKEFVNPPVMIFSILPLKLKEKKAKNQKKEGEKRFLHVYIDYENKNISHTVLTISVQPKFYRIKYGPLQLNLSKSQAIMISFISILITIISAAYSLMTIKPTSSTTDILGISAPGLGSLIFIITFLFTLIKRGVFPIKEQLSSLLNIDKGTAIIK
jgi:hypothetical protein